MDSSAPSASAWCWQTCGTRGAPYGYHSSRYRLSFVFYSRLPHFIIHQRAVDVAASLKPTVAASTKRSCGSFEIGHGHSRTLVPCIRSHASAGHIVVCVVTGLVVGDRRSPGRQYWEVSSSTSSAAMISQTLRRPLFLLSQCSCISFVLRARQLVEFPDVRVLRFVGRDVRLQACTSAIVSCR